MNKQEILDKVTRAQAKIDKAQEELDKAQELLKEYEIKNTKEIKRWKPEHSGEYWIVDSWGMVYNEIWTNSNGDKKRYNFYNCFETREQAEQEAEKILVRRMLEDIARRLNRGKKIDWENYDQAKYFIYIDCEDIGYNFDITVKTQGTVYCLSSDFIKVAIQEIGEERLKRYLRR